MPKTNVKELQTRVIQLEESHTQRVAEIHALRKNAETLQETLRQNYDALAASINRRDRVVGELRDARLKISELNRGNPRQAECLLTAIFAMEEAVRVLEGK